MKIALSLLVFSLFSLVGFSQSTLITNDIGGNATVSIIYPDNHPNQNLTVVGNSSTSSADPEADLGIEFIDFEIMGWSGTVDATNNYVTTVIGGITYVVELTINSVNDRELHFYTL